MPDDRDIEGLDDFAGAMQLLASQAAAKASAGPGGPRGDRNEILLEIGQMIRPLAKELEDLRVKTEEQSRLLTALGKNMKGQGEVGTTLESLREQMLRLGSVESANSKLFDALHTELKGYKDNFLFDALQKPFVRDLVSLFDDLSEVHASLLRRLEATPADSDEAAYLKTTAGNVENQVHHMIEVFLRMDVTISQTRPGAPLDKKAHRVVSVEAAALPAEDGLIHRSVKPGFQWRDRHIRAEDVVVRRWTPSASTHAAPARVTAIIPNAGSAPDAQLLSSADADAPPASSVR